jgi:hypothetical protein
MVLTEPSTVAEEKAVGHEVWMSVSVMTRMRRSRAP